MKKWLLVLVSMALLAVPAAAREQESDSRDPLDSSDDLFRWLDVPIYQSEALSRFDQESPGLDFDHKTGAPLIPLAPDSSMDPATGQEGPDF
jgi:hypothetical protein